ncbi:hypothetical protein F5Y05DRAFT_370633 [Hypoxylon sp. FL0543]|nr:hypothetical protein F5Y05DRAFT_370633 [Hypoxylon sp. FL0543]
MTHARFVFLLKFISFQLAGGLLYHLYSLFSGWKYHISIVRQCWRLGCCRFPFTVVQTVILVSYFVGFPVRSNNVAYPLVYSLGYSQLLNVSKSVD